MYSPPSLHKREQGSQFFILVQQGSLFPIPLQQGLEKSIPPYNREQRNIFPTPEQHRKKTPLPCPCRTGHKKVYSPSFYNREQRSLFLTPVEQGTRKFIPHPCTTGNNYEDCFFLDDSDDRHKTSVLLVILVVVDTVPDCHMSFTPVTRVPPHLLLTVHTRKRWW